MLEKAQGSGYHVNKSMLLEGHSEVLREKICRSPRRVGKCVGQSVGRGKNGQVNEALTIPPVETRNLGRSGRTTKSPGSEGLEIYASGHFDTSRVLAVLSVQAAGCRPKLRFGAHWGVPSTSRTGRGGWSHHPQYQVIPCSYFSPAQVTLGRYLTQRTIMRY